MNLLIDLPLAPRVAAELSADGHDAVHLSDQGLSRLKDGEIFARLCRRDASSLLPIWTLAKFARTGSNSVSGVVLRLVNLEADRVVKLLRGALLAAAVELARGAVVLIEESWLRIRRLPLGA